MNNNHIDDTDAETWELACQCADFYIQSDIARTYGLKFSLEFIYEATKVHLPADLIDRALEFRRQTFPVEEVHQACRQFLAERHQQAANRASRTARLPCRHPRAWKHDETKLVLGHHRYQLPVGQGGFNVGTLRDLGSNEKIWRQSLVSDAIPAADFMYVYDCGSDPIEGVVKYVRSVVSRRPSRKLDMLFVSHFDRDHICGIPHLLHEKKGLRVDTIVMPYLDDIERIIAFGRSASTSGERVAERFHKDVIVDPIGAMATFGPRQIVMVMPDEEDDADLGLLELFPAEPPRSGPDGLPWEGKDTAGRRSTRPMSRRSPEGATVVQHIEFSVGAGTEGGWTLKPHVKRTARRDREAFCTAVEVALNWPRDSFEQKVKDMKERRLLVTKHRSAVARAYTWAFGNKNETSLVLYSGPAEPQKAGAVYKNGQMFEKARVGWMGTGDVDFKDPLTVRRFQNYYRDELAWVTTFMLPHHGSANNFDPSLFVIDAELWVAAAKPIHKKWKHPAPEIVRAVKANGARFRKVSSAPKSLLEEKMVVFWPG